jgi:EpsI family protein
MIGRRDLLIGGTCAAALATAEYLRPRRILTLFQGKLEASVPRSFGRWSDERGGDFIIPKRPGSLSERLYASQLARNYRQDSFSPPMMLVIAYGGAQSDSLQIHRPEFCYPAVGFSIAQRQLTNLKISDRVSIPAVAMTAEMPDRVEDVVYWTRLGEYLPQTAGQQRKDRLATSLDGYIGDGMLVRASTIRSDGPPRYAEISAFLASLVMSLNARVRPGFIGTARAQQMTIV